MSDLRHSNGDIEQVDEMQESVDRYLGYVSMPMTIKTRKLLRKSIKSSKSWEPCRLGFESPPHAICMFLGESFSFSETQSLT